jgi:serine/threonine protein kinase
MIYDPCLEQSFTFVKTIGKGSQATVDLYQGITTLEKYAVKKYEVTDESYDEIEKIVKNEISFLRELRVCNNIVYLDSVYYRVSERHPGTKYIMMVMRLAKDGSLL